jgi:hypothetical protein
MTPSLMLRPVLLGLLGLATASCGEVGSDPHRFQSMAQAVADIPLDGSDRKAPAPARPALRPAFAESRAEISPAPLRVEVMSPHDLWDARDAGLRGSVEAMAPAVMQAAAPVVTQAVVRQMTERSLAPEGQPKPEGQPQPEAQPALRLQAQPAVAREVARTTLQLGAFASPAAAQRAWSRISEAGQGVAELSPMFESVQVDGRSLTRLKVSAPADAARAVCRAADAANLGCLRRG